MTRMPWTLNIAEIYQLSRDGSVKLQMDWNPSKDNRSDIKKYRGTCGHSERDIMLELFLLFPYVGTLFWEQVISKRDFSTIQWLTGYERGEREREREREHNKRITCFCSRLFPSLSCLPHAYDALCMLDFKVDIASLYDGDTV